MTHRVAVAVVKIRAARHHGMGKNSVVKTGSAAFRTNQGYQPFLHIDSVCQFFIFHDFFGCFTVSAKHHIPIRIQNYLLGNFLGPVSKIFIFNIGNIIR